MVAGNPGSTSRFRMRDLSCKSQCLRFPLGTTRTGLCGRGEEAVDPHHLGHKANRASRLGKQLPSSRPRSSLSRRGEARSSRHRGAYKDKKANGSFSCGARPRRFVFQVANVLPNPSIERTRLAILGRASNVRRYVSQRAHR